MDMFTRRSHPDQPLMVQHSPNCRTIRLIAGPEEFVPRDQIRALVMEKKTSRNSI
ncbi:hypothetical protein [Planktothrix agardhii]|nr:hypothetical protein [Planktothrix agardhii]